LRDIFHWVALTLAPGVGSVLFKRLIEHFGSPEAVFKAKPRDLERIEGIGSKVIVSLQKFDWGGKAEKELRAAEKAGARIVILKDEEYPENLRFIYDPPPLLYVLGSLEPRDQWAIAVVGSRYPTTYGKSAAERIAMRLGRQGMTIVSGLARGVDSWAHRGALGGGGRTIGVLGCGIDIVYPPENQDLYDQVAAQGAVLSEFPMGTPPDSDHFPIRNRIISGLSKGVVVVEATLRSGSLITARLALEQGREVFALPGNIDSSRSAGANQLIQQGAKLVTQAEDILEEFYPAASLKISTPSAELRLSEEEKKVFGCLTSEAMHIDQVITRSALASSKVASILLSLELAGHIKQLPGMRFVKT
jgi:DNA processing protein